MSNDHLILVNVGETYIFSIIAIFTRTTANFNSLEFSDLYGWLTEWHRPCY